MPRISLLDGICSIFLECLFYLALNCSFKSQICIIQLLSMKHICWSFSTAFVWNDAFWGFYALTYWCFYSKCSFSLISMFFSLLFEIINWGWNLALSDCFIHFLQFLLFSMLFSCWTKKYCCFVFSFFSLHYWLLDFHLEWFLS